MSTRKIENSLFNESINLLTENFISIAFTPFDKPNLLGKQVLVFTSKNAVQSLFTRFPSIDLSDHQVVCVGEKTRHKLMQFGVEVTHSDLSSGDLGRWILSSNRFKEVLAFCGDIRRRELKELIEKSPLKYREIIVYKTELTPVEIKTPQSGIIFLSPSAVQSFKMKNDMPESVAFCIGNTTANEAKKYFSRVEISKDLSIESVVEKVNDYYDIK